ncbi:galectin-8-like isoform X2 [Cynoglossus semilaevis]|uniref:galectin-8-like isoform X2 n=1 Tax=Cynoglossus semilaevis TaxID=244447 RepID=UPI0007DC8780|nr:galectin-8-like isoform X2 [Cynoglossus semilaevis]
MLVSRTRQTFLKPSIPFAGTILGGLLPGEMVLVQGSVPVGADRFQVDLACGSSMKPRADVAFHFNPRFSGSPCVVCNTLQCERWGPEEIQHQNPLKSAHTFELVFLVLQDKFKVAVNGAHLLQYKQRVALERVDTILISGKVAVEVVGVVPSMSNAPLAVSNIQDSQMKSILSTAGNTRVPFSGFLGDGLRVGQSVSIRAETNHNAQSYADDNQLSLSPPPVDSTVSAPVSDGLSDISAWVEARHLQVNLSSTELLVFPAKSTLHHDISGCHHGQPAVLYRSRWSWGH